MDAVGQLELKWSKGYSGERVRFIKGDIVVYKLGNVIKFIDSSKPASAIDFIGPKEGMGTIACHYQKKLFAYNTLSFTPQIVIHNYPSMQVQKILKKVAKMKITNIAFSSGDYIAATNEIPDFKLSIWNFTTGDLVASVRLADRTPITNLSFNPLSWKLIAFTSRDHVSICSVDKCNEQSFINIERRIRYPHVGTPLGPVNKLAEHLLPIGLSRYGHRSMSAKHSLKEQSEHDPLESNIFDRAMSHTSSTLSRSTVLIPHHNIAGIRSDQAEGFEEHEDEFEHLKPTDVVWSNLHEIVVSCVDGQLLKIDTKTFEMTILCNPIQFHSSMELENGESVSPSLVYNTSKIRDIPDESFLDPLHNPRQRPHHHSVVQRVSHHFRHGTQNRHHHHHHHHHGRHGHGRHHHHNRFHKHNYSRQLYPRMRSRQQHHHHRRHQSRNRGHSPHSPSPQRAPAHHAQHLQHSPRQLSPRQLSPRQLNPNSNHYNNHNNNSNNNDDGNLDNSNNNAKKRGKKGALKIMPADQGIPITMQTTDNFRRARNLYQTFKIPKPNSKEKSKDQNQIVSQDELPPNTPDTISQVIAHKKGFLVAGEGVIYELEKSGKYNHLNVKATYDLGVKSDITSLTVDPNYSHFAVGTRQGELRIFNIANINANQTLFTLGQGKIVAFDMLDPGCDILATIRSNGDLQLWDISSASLISTTHFKMKPSALKCSPITHMIVIGDQQGYLTYVSAMEPSKPVAVHYTRFNMSCVRHLQFNSIGSVLAIAGDENIVFLTDGRPTNHFKVLGGVVLPGRVHCISCNNDTSVVADNHRFCVSTNRMPSNKLVVPKHGTSVVLFDITDNILADPSKFHKNLKGHLKPDQINLQIYHLSGFLDGATISSNNFLYGLTANQKFIMKYKLPVKGSKETVLQPKSKFKGHSTKAGKCKISANFKWLCSYGRDGTIILRTLSAMNRTVEIQAHLFQKHGIKDIAFTTDSNFIFTLGFDGVINCLKLNYTQAGIQKAKLSQAEAAKSFALLAEIGMPQDEKLLMMKVKTAESMKRDKTIIETKAEKKSSILKLIAACIQNDAIYVEPTIVRKTNPTWLQNMEFNSLNKDVENAAQFKVNLRTNIRQMRRKIKVLLETNSKVPDIEKLSRPEFDLDIQQQKKLRLKGDLRIKDIERQIEKENLTNQYLTAKIKKECWDNMQVKGRSILSFQSSLMVDNYPMKPLNIREKYQLEHTLAVRAIENSENLNRSNIVENRNKVNPTAIETKDRIASATEKLANADAVTVDNESMQSVHLLTQNHMSNSKITPQEAPAPVEEVSVDDDDLEAGNVEGSLSRNYGARHCHALYSQFELISREQKQVQIIALKSVIRMVQSNFNNSFQEILDCKDSEIQKILEKNKRLTKIYKDLGMEDVSKNIQFTPIEKPEQLLVVEDSEIKVEKYLTEEEKNELQRKEEERLKQLQFEQDNNWRERGLQDMMDGVLEMRKEDELKKDIPKPAFIGTKNEDEYTEEEVKIAEDYNAKYAELEEEREKYQKQLEVEMKKLEEQIAEKKIAFDEMVQELFQKKIKCEMVIFQEELKILRLRLSLLFEEEMNNRKADLHTILLKNSKERAKISDWVADVRSMCIDYKEKLETLGMEDRLIEKFFKKTFHDTTAVQYDNLLKLFKRRPRAIKTKGAETPVVDSGFNPFVERTNSASNREATKLALKNGIIELNKDVNCPDSVDDELWIRLCNYRNTKIQSEQTIKTKALILTEMQNFLQKKVEDEMNCLEMVNVLSSHIQRLKDDQIRYTNNLEVQLVLKQGQVENQSGSYVCNFRNSILVHRGVIEDLNTKIRQLGERKISNMEDSKDFRKGIIQLEWEYKRIAMEMEDLINKMRDINNMKVTRNIQSFLATDDYDAKKAKDIFITDQTIALYLKLHETSLSDKKKVLMEKKRLIRQKAEDNVALRRQLASLNVAVNERRHIHEVIDPDSSMDNAQRLEHDANYRDILQRRKLVDLAKGQAQEVAVLRVEVERLRMRTFPALVQVER